MYEYILRVYGFDEVIMAENDIDYTAGTWTPTLGTYGDITRSTTPEWRITLIPPPLNQMYAYTYGSWGVVSDRTYPEPVDPNMKLPEGF